MAKRLEGQRMMPKQTLRQWLDEDAERINRMTDLAKRNKVTVPVDDPPELNEYGGYVESKDDEDEAENEEEEYIENGDDAK
jgi:hypothetical protein